MGARLSTLPFTQEELHAALNADVPTGDARRSSALLGGLNDAQRGSVLTMLHAIRLGAATPLGAAVLEGNASLVRLLVSVGVSPLQYDVQGHPFLFRILDSQRLAQLPLAVWMINTAPSMRLIRDPEGNSLLHRLLASGIAFDVLCAALKDAHVATGGKTTVDPRTFAATWLENACLVSELDFAAKNLAGQSPLFAALEGGHLEYFRWMLAVALRNREALTLPIDGGDPLNASGSALGLTLLHICAARALTAELESLLGAPGIVVDVATADGVTPLHCAVEAGCVAAVAALVAAGAPLLCRDVYGRSALSLAAAHPDGTALAAALTAAATDAAALRAFASPSAPSAVRFQLVSDVHIEFHAGAADKGAAMLAAVLVPRAPILALLGDIGLVCQPAYHAFVLAQAAVFETVLLLPGNHEFYRAPSISHAMRGMHSLAARAPRGNVRVMDMATFETGGVLFIGATLWGRSRDEADAAQLQMRFNDYRRVRSSDPAAVTMAPHPEAVADADGVALTSEAIEAGAWSELAETHPAVRVAQTDAFHDSARAFIREQVAAAAARRLTAVVLTHHAPIVCPSVSAVDYVGSSLASGIATDQTDLMAPPMAVWAYGHTHWFVDRMVGAVRVVSNPKGYPTDRLDWTAARANFVIDVPVASVRASVVDGPVDGPVVDSVEASGAFVV